MAYDFRVRARHCWAMLRHREWKAVLHSWYGRFVVGRMPGGTYRIGKPVPVDFNKRIDDA